LCDESEFKDELDRWQLEMPNAFDNFWRVGSKIKLIHVKTNSALHSHSKKSRNSNEQEVTCFYNNDDNDYWVACEINPFIFTPNRKEEI